MIESLPERIANLPDPLRQTCRSILYVDSARGYTVPPASMEPWIEQHFGAVEQVREQTIIKVTNRHTLESALFNPIRARRPNQAGGDDAALERWLAQELAEHDVFRDPERDTTADVFGRIHGRYCMSASNIAKYEGWHGLVIFNDPNPLRFGAAQLHDFLDVALRWIAAAHALDAQAIYPLITWNCLPKSGATLVHGHMQVALARGMHYARVESWRRASCAHRLATGASYYADLFAIHQALGLAIAAHEQVRVFAHLTPARNREIVFLADPAATSAIGDLAGAITAALRRLIDDHGLRAFNMAIALPPIGPTEEDWSDTPIVARIGDRGDPLSNRGDIGAMELFASGCITADPFEVAAYIRQTGRQGD